MSNNCEKADVEKLGVVQELLDETDEEVRKNEQQQDFEGGDTIQEGTQEEAVNPDEGYHEHSTLTTVETEGDDGDCSTSSLNLSVDPPDGSEDFFERFSSIRITYDASEKKTIQEFEFKPDVVDAAIADQLYPTLGGWNVDDLYSEVLYALVHTIRSQSETDGLISHLQQVFHIDNDKHEKLVQSAKDKKAPPMVLNLEVVEAKGLKGKDVNGLSDPFCTLYVSPRQKHNTSMKPETLSPVWREYFSFPVTSVIDETLNIEVWDYDPEETLSDKMRRFGEVKSTRGLRILMKEIALTASTGKQTHEFLGCLKIPLRDIPNDGLDKWFVLESRNGNGHKKKGDIHLRMGLGAEKERKVAAQEYRHVLHLLLVHQLDEEIIQQYQWEGQFMKCSEYILRQLQLQGGLTQKDVDLAQWLVYTRVQCEHPLNAKLFPLIFENIIECVKKQAISDDEIRKFWFATEKLIENFATFVRNIHQSFLVNSNSTSQVYHMLKTLELLKNYLSTRPMNNKEMEIKVTADFIIEKTENAISRGAHDLFQSICVVDGSNGDTRVETMIKIGQLLIADLRKGHETLQSLFKELLGIEYFDITYQVYDDLYCELVKPIVEDICQKLKPIDNPNNDDFFQDKEVTTGTSLFELYLAVKQFSDLSEEMTCKKDLCISGTFHTWFHASVSQWLDIACFKAMNRINKAVQLDNLKPVDDVVQFTSSAVDTAHIFHQIQIFWNQLAWPEVEGSYTFIAKILDDLCKNTIYYAETMCRKVDELEKAQEYDKYEISDELCLAINNIEWVGLEMKPISEKLGTNSILAQLSATKGEAQAKQCRRTLSTLMENAIENINNKIIEILEKVGYKMRPVIQRLLLEGAETDNEESGVEKLMKYLDNNLIKLKNKLSSTTFDKVFTIIWENASVALKDLLRTNIEKRRPPSFFKQIHNMLQILTKFFYPEGTGEIDAVYNVNIREIQNLIGFYGASTTELIMKYDQTRFQTQKKLKKGNLGMLTVRSHYCEDARTLRIEILNARNIVSRDSNGQCDPYVKLKLVPEDVFHMTPKFKTKVKKRTLFPLFDETFSIFLTPDEMSLGGLIVFSVKDHDLFGRNEFLGEAFLPLESIPFTSGGTSLQDLPQVHLVLTMPTDPNSPILQALENRQWDKAACDFVKKEKHKILEYSQIGQGSS